MICIQSYIHQMKIIERVRNICPISTFHSFFLAIKLIFLPSNQDKNYICFQNGINLTFILFPSIFHCDNFLNLKNSYLLTVLLAMTTTTILKDEAARQIIKNCVTWLTSLFQSLPNFMVGFTLMI